MLLKLLTDKEIKQFKKLVNDASNIVLTCHVRPDGDAIGSTLGLALLLNQLGKQCTVVAPDTPPKSLAFLPRFNEVVTYTRYPEFTVKVVEGADLIICCDFNQPSRQDNLAEVISASNAPKVLIDHHQKPDQFCQLTISYPAMSSTCELAFRLICGCGWYETMDRDAATCLCTGLITDTRNLSVNCNNPDIYIVLMKLIEKGVDKQRIVREALEMLSLDSLRLRAYALSEKLEISKTHRSALITLDRNELERFNYERGDCEGLVNEPLRVHGIRYSIFMREDPGCIKVSARSVDNFPVSEICEDLFNGGGHRMAAGGEFYGTLEECRQLLIENQNRYDKYLTQSDNNK